MLPATNSREVVGWFDRDNDAAMAKQTPKHADLVGMGKELTYRSVSRCSQTIAGALDVEEAAA